MTTPKTAAAIAAAWLLLTATTAPAQGTRADYERAEALPGKLQGKVFKARVQPHWSHEDMKFWYRNDLPEGRREFVAVDIEKKERGPAFDHARLAEALAKFTGQAFDPGRLPIDRIALEDDGAIRFEALGQGWRFDPKAGTLGEFDRPEAEPANPDRPRRVNRGRADSPRRSDSPDGKWTAVVRDHDVFLRDKEKDIETRLTEGGTAEDGYEPGVFWAPDSAHLVALKTAKGQEHKVSFIESSPRFQVQPKLSSHNYLKPGDKLPITRPHLFDVASKKEIPVKDDLFANPWSVGDYRWSPDSKQFTFLFNQRGHQALRVVAIDAATGEAKALIDETTETFIDYSSKMHYQRLDRTNEILWMSERSGWNHLYLIDATTGAVKNPITKGEWVVRGVDLVDEEARQIWFRMSGMDPGEDPYHVHYARIDFDGSNFTWLTEGNGTHDVRFSPKWKYFIDTYSQVDQPPFTVLRSAWNGHKILDLETADVSRLREAGWKPPERFVAKGRDGKTDIYGLIYRPTNFDPARKYPVIEQIYAGPHGAHVPKSFAAIHGPEALAELGFILVEIDGMGTNWRSRAFHDVCWKNLGDAGFPDRILWMKAAAEKEPAMDLSRVGIYGGSAGGQNALGALLFHPEFYKAASADCGCHDNRMDKIWWNEQWMGWPVGPHYAEQSNVTNAHKLRGDLLLMVGELDHNVDPASTMQVANALIKAGKDFELIVFPGADHGAGGSPYGRRRQRDFFVRHLLGVEPPRRNSASSP